MGVAENKALVLRFYDEVWDKGNVDVAGEAFRDDLGLTLQLGAEVFAGAAPTTQG
jgi:hypothetical protein